MSILIACDTHRRRCDTECLACKRPEGAVNHVPGAIFVGWGTGWQTCNTCNGTQRVPREPPRSITCPLPAAPATNLNLIELEKHLADLGVASPEEVARLFVDELIARLDGTVTPRLMALNVLRFGSDLRNGEAASLRRLPKCLVGHPTAVWDALMMEVPDLLRALYPEDADAVIEAIRDYR